MTTLVIESESFWFVLQCSTNCQPLKEETLYVLFKDPTRTVRLTLSLGLKTYQLLLCREILAVYFEIHTQINKMCG